MAVQLDAATLQAALVGYRQQLEEIEQKMAEIRRKLGNSGSRSISASTSGESASKGASKPRARRHQMSAEGRARIAAAQRARWAKTKRAVKKAEE